jgi:CIC family chloride channel protein
MKLNSQVQEVLFLLLAILIGGLAGAGSLAFLAFIAVGQWGLWPGAAHFLGQVMLAPWWLRLLIPALGGLLVGPVIAFWVPEARGTGVPEVMEALALREGYIPPRMAVLKAWCTGVTIATGGSVGREGPVVGIGAAIGSSLGRLFGCSQEKARICLACGAAAGIAATFNAPLAGALFAVEIILADLEIFYLGHIVIAAVVSVIISHRFIFFPVFVIPAFQFKQLSEIGLYFLLGILAGLLAIAFTRCVYATDAWFRRLALPEWLKPAIGGLCLGGVGVLSPYVLGVGYDAINLSLAGKFVLGAAGFVLLAKFLATILCLGSGMSGGIMGPSLFLGAMLGTCLAAGANLLIPGLQLAPSDYALIGMGAMVSGTTFGPITAMLIILESANNHRVIMPLMVSCMASLMTVRYLYGYSTYETKLVRRGVQLVRGHEVHILQSLKVKDYLTTGMEVVRDDTPLPEILQKAETSPQPLFVVLNRQDELSGVLTPWDLRRVLPGPENPRLTARDLMSAPVATVTLEDDFVVALKRLEGNNYSFLPVVLPPEGKKVVGLLKREDVLSAYSQQLIKERLLR